MKIFSTSLLTLLLTTSAIHGGEDPWRGDDYAKNSESQKSSAEDFMKKTGFSGSESVLDVGCGDGKITAAMAKALVRGAVLGVDISPSMIQTAQKTFSQEKNLSFEVTDAAAVNFTEKFDLITSFTVMQWVLDQRGALHRFEKALRPGGKLWIQMPTGLPSAMEEALQLTLSDKKWAPYFIHFAAPWKFYSADEYRTLLIDAHLTPLRLDVATKHEHFPSRAAFQGFLRQWFPYLRPLPEDQKDAFLTALLDRYFTILPVDNEGRASFIVDRLEIEATK